MSAGFPEKGDIFVNKYNVKSILGSGGFSRIYHAIQVDLDRDVALKIMRPPIDDSMSSTDQSDYLERVTIRFQQEAKLISKLRSPYTITMFDYGRTESGLLYMVLEYVHGYSIADLLESGDPIEPDRVVKIIGQVLVSLHEAHAMDMLHRDLKPANIMVYEHLGEPDQVKLLDFGIAKVVGDSKPSHAVDLTSDGNIIGTPRYMSPEQIRGDEELAPSSDLYSLGLVCYEMLTGQKAIPGNSSLQIITKQIAAESFELPKDLQIPPQLRKIVNRMMQKDMRKRYTSAQEVSLELEEVNLEKPRAMRISRLSTSLKSGDFKPTLPSKTTPSLGPLETNATHDPVSVAILQKSETRKITLPTKPDLEPSTLEFVELEPVDEPGSAPPLQHTEQPPASISSEREATASSDSLPTLTPNSSAEIAARVDRSAERKPPALPASISRETLIASPPPEDISGELEELILDEDEEEGEELVVAIASAAEEAPVAWVADDSMNLAIGVIPTETQKKKKRLALALGGLGAIILIFIVFAIISTPKDTPVDAPALIAQEQVGLEQPGENDEPDDEEVLYADEELAMDPDDLSAEWLEELEDDRTILIRAQPEGAEIRANDVLIGNAPLDLAVKDHSFPLALSATFQGTTKEKTLDEVVDELLFEFTLPPVRTVSPGTSTNNQAKASPPRESKTPDTRRKFQYRSVD